MIAVLPTGRASAYNRAYGDCSLMSPRIGTLDALVGTTTLGCTAVAKHGPFIFVLAFRSLRVGGYQGSSNIFVP